MPALAFLKRLAGRAEHYNPFNLLVFDGTQLAGLQSHGAQIVAMQPGIGAVSNADFHSPWPKLTWLRGALETHVNRNRTSRETDDGLDVEALLSILKNDATAPDDALPQTGLPLLRERVLSAAFITSPDYGTRACSVVKIARTKAEFVERSFDVCGELGTQHHSFSLIPGATIPGDGHDRTR